MVVRNSLLYQAEDEASYDYALEVVDLRCETRD